MTKLKELRSRLTSLEAEQAEIRNKGFLTDARIDSARSGGNATGARQIQYRLRLKGKPVVYLGTGDQGKGKAAAYREQIANGKRLKQVQREMKRVIEQIERIAAIAAETGLEVPKTSTIASINYSDSRQPKHP